MLINHYSTSYKNIPRYRNNLSFQKYRPILIIIVYLTIITCLFILIKSALKNTTNSHNNISIILPPLNSSSIVIPPTKIDDAEPSIAAKNVILIDSQTNYPLYAKKTRQRIAIASLTKIMTAIIALEEYDLNTIITIPKNIYSISGAKMGLYPNEKISVNNLIWGMLLNSGNDAAYALASYKNSDIKNVNHFVILMNQKATALGLTDTKFYDPAGLNDKGYSSAFDLTIITKYALQKSLFSKIVSTGKKKITNYEKYIIHYLANTNRLINHQESLFYPYAIGVKTGYTDKAGHCLVSAARYNNHLVIGIVLNTYFLSNDASARQSKKLLQWGFSHYRWQ